MSGPADPSSHSPPEPVALVTGGRGDLGRAIARDLLAQGVRVVTADVAPEHAERDEVSGVDARHCDVSDSQAVRTLVQSVLAEHGRLDVLVHCAGITRDRVLWKLSDEDWRDVLRVNLDSAFYLLRAAAPALRSSGRGAVVLVASINGERGKFGQTNYSASKAGLIGLARSAARELGRDGVRVNVVAPGWIHTRMTASLGEDLRAAALAETALGRLGLPEDVAAAVRFLCLDAPHVTGQVLRVDGGQLMA